MSFIRKVASLFLKIVVLLVSALTLVNVAQAQLLVDSGSVDAISSDGVCTLREAIQAANLNAPVNECVDPTGEYDTITFDSNVAVVTLDAVGLTEDDNQTGDLDIADSLTIYGNFSATTIDATYLSDRAFDITAGVPVTFYNLVIRGGVADNDVVPSGGDESCAGGGGAVRASIVGTALWLVDVVLEGNAARVGGGLCAANSSIWLESSKVSDNSAEIDGGGIYVTNSALTSIQSRIEDNIAGLNLSDENKGGGGVFASNTTVTLTDTEVFRNTAFVWGTGGGGGIYIDNNGVLNLTGGVIRSNQALQWGQTASSLAGGGAFVESSAVVKDSAIRENVVSGTASSQGGGLYALGTLDISGTSVRSNQLRGFGTAQGGGIWVQGVITALGSSVEQNQILGAQSGYGGGMHLVVTHMTLQDMFVAGNVVSATNASGGGIKLNVLAAPSSLTISNSAIENNQIVGQLVSGAGIDGEASPSSEIVLSNTNVTGNSAWGESGGRGGGVFVLRMILTATTSYVDGNTVQVLDGNAAGGGILSALGRVVLLQTTVEENIISGTASLGAGIFLLSSSIDANTSVISGNRSLAATSALGGGVYAESSNRLSFTSTNIANNMVSASTATGGGLHVNFMSEKLSLNNSTVSGNRATSTSSTARCGGILSAARDNYVFGGSIRGNSAQSSSSSQGGGICVDIPALLIKLENVIVDGNQVLSTDGSASGGGLRSFADMTVISATRLSNNIVRGASSARGGGAEILDLLTATSVSVTNNQVTASVGTAEGGGIWSAFVASTVSSTLVANNLAYGLSALGGGAFLSSPDTKLLATTFEGNLAFATGAGTSSAARGGGLHLQPLSSVVMQTVVLSNNVASALSATAQGGGLFVESVGSSSLVTLTRALVLANKVTGTQSYGGGLFTETDLTVLTSTVSGNQALQGGGIAVMGINARLRLRGSALIGNQSDGLLLEGTGPTHVLNTTLSGNSGRGVVNVTGTTYITHATVASNTSVGVLYTGGALQTAAVVIAYNQPTNCSGSPFSVELANLSSDDTCPFSAQQRNVNPLLQPLALNGGDTLNHGLPPNSPAVNATVCGTNSDQRGLSRPQGVKCDIGAFEAVLDPVNLLIAKFVSDSNVPGNSTVTYTLIVTNVGPNPAEMIVVTDVLQGGALWGGILDVTPSNVSVTVGSSTQVTFALPSLSVGTSMQVVYTVTSPSSGSFTNTATAVAYGNSELTLLDNVSEQSVTVYNVELEKVVMTASLPGGVVLPGQLITYVLVLTSTGQGSVPNVLITDALPSGVSFVAVTQTPPFNCEYGGDLVVSCTSSVFAPGVSLITITAAAPITPGTSITNIAVVSADGISKVSNPSSVTVNRESLLEIAKIQSYQQLSNLPQGVLLPGQLITYTILVTNTGPGVAVNVLVTDLLPLALDFVTVTQTFPFACTHASLVVCSALDMSPGSTAAITIEARMPITPGVSVVNVATVSSLGSTEVSSSSSAMTAYRVFLPIAKSTGASSPFAVFIPIVRLDF